MLAVALVFVGGISLAASSGPRRRPEQAREVTPDSAPEEAPVDSESPDQETPDPIGVDPRSSAVPSGPLTLEQCLELARRKNLDMMIAEHKRRRARLDVASARAAFLPTLTASYTRDYDTERDSGSLGLSQSTPWGTAFSVTGNHSTDPAEQSSSSVSATVSQDLLRGLGPATARAALSIAEENERAARARFERVAQDTIFTVKSQYYDVARLLATIEVRRRAVARAKWFREGAALKRDLGVITVLGYEDAAIQLADREAELVSSRSRLEDALDRLKELLDIPLGEEVSIVPVTLDIEETDTETERTEIAIDREAGTVSVVRTRAQAEGEPSIEVRPVFTPAERDFEELAEEAGEARPDLRAARSGLAVTRIELRRKRYELFNELKLSATYTASGEGDASEDSLDMHQEGWKLSANYSWPVGRRVRRADHEKAALDVATKEAEIRKLEVAVEKEIRRISRSLGETETNILNYAQTISAAARALEAANYIRREGGEMTYWEVTARESALLNARTRFINACLDYRKRLAELDLAVGKESGWTEGR